MAFPVLVITTSDKPRLCSARIALLGAIRASFGNEAIFHGRWRSIGVANGKRVFDDVPAARLRRGGTGVDVPPRYAIIGVFACGAALQHSRPDSG
jgi:hypothetical protein